MKAVLFRWTRGFVVDVFLVELVDCVCCHKRLFAEGLAVDVKDCVIAGQASGGEIAEPRCFVERNALSLEKRVTKRRVVR